MKDSLTEADKEALAACPRERWFRYRDLPFPAVKRSRYRCQRLLERGFLKKRIAGDPPLGLYDEYHLTEKAREELT